MLLKNKLTFSVLLFLLPLSQIKVYSQDQKGMLMYQIENKQFKKTSFDKEGKILSIQYIKVGNIVEINKDYILDIKIKSFNNKGVLQKEETSQYSCNIKGGNIFMGVIPFINKPSKKMVINVLSKNTLYPSDITASKRLNDYKIGATYKAGFLGVNTKINIDYKDRSINKTSVSTYVITGAIQIKIYVAGVNVSRINYKSEEILDLSKGVIFQKFVEDSGAYFTISLVSK
jgi:hypothetical protein